MTEPINPERDTMHDKEKCPLCRADMTNSYGTPDRSKVLSVTDVHGTITDWECIECGGQWPAAHE